MNNQLLLLATKDLLSSFVTGLFFTTLLFLTTVSVVIIFKIVICFIKDKLTEKEPPKPERKPRVTPRKKIRSINVNPDEVDRIVVKRD